KKNPMVHLFPYWDFNIGQPIDVLVCSNAPMVELFFNGKSLGKRALDHKNGRDDLIAHWQIPYEKGTICARAYDENNCCIAVEEHSSFGDAASLVLTADREVLRADGRDLIFVTVRAADKDGNFVENANLRVEVSVSGKGRLLGLDNGDSTDSDQYKCTSRRLFSGKLLALIGAGLTEGEIRVQVKAAGLASKEISLWARALTEEEIKKEELMGIRMPKDARLLLVDSKGASFVPAGEISTDRADAVTDEIPIRKLELTTDDGFCFSPEKRQITVMAKPLPENADRAELIWKVTTDTGIESNLAALSISENQAIVTAQGDGEFLVRCMTKNNTDKIRVISQL
ncbi:MAG: DUF4982 domain-containing protein, partial [Lachnospiraceae bacterium]|nr:DUF4982 domain-containing protein [Lachnospiraceae bacterium]